MRRLLIFVLALLASTALSASLAACRQVPEGPALSTSTRLSVNSAEGPTLTPTPTETPTPTPMPEGLNYLPAGIIAVRNADGTWGVGIDEGDQIAAIISAWKLRSGREPTVTTNNGSWYYKLP